MKSTSCQFQIRDHSLFMTGGGLAKKGVGHEVFLTEKGGPPKNISSEGGVQLFIIVDKNLTCNNYCYHMQGGSNNRCFAGLLVCRVKSE